MPGWTDEQRLEDRLRRAEEAKAAHTEAQQALEKARRKDLHPRMRFVIARDEATAKLLRARELVKDAERALDPSSRVPEIRPEREVTVQNRSSRRGVKPRLIVVHSTESHNRPGLSDIDSIISWFDDPKSQASSHVVNDGEGHDARLVPDAEKAWTCAAFNSVSLNIEQIGQAAQSEWPSVQLDNTALWLAKWSVAHGIPLTESTTRGVCRHADLGKAGGGHHDPGAAFPLDDVLARARIYARGLTKRT